MKEILLTKGMTAIVNDEDYDYINQSVSVSLPNEVRFFDIDFVFLCFMFGVRFERKELKGESK